MPHRHLTSPPSAAVVPARPRPVLTSVSGWPGSTGGFDLVLVGGVPGSGKTTAIARATDDLAHISSIDPTTSAGGCGAGCRACPTAATAGWCT